jgi:hypothetical protein
MTSRSEVDAYLRTTPPETWWRFHAEGKYLGRLLARPGETHDQALARLVALCPSHAGKDITVQGGP